MPLRYRVGAIPGRYEDHRVWHDAAPGTGLPLLPKGRRRSDPDKKQETGVDKQDFRRVVKGGRRLAEATLALVAMAAIAPAQAAGAAAAYPEKPIRLIVPFTAGGQFDYIARLVSVPLGKELGQTVIVENVGGGGGNLGGAKVASAAADGYILLEYGGNFAIAKHLSPKLTYDPIADLAPVSGLSIAPHVVLVNSALPIKTFAELQAYAKAHPGKLSYGSPGVGSSMHLTFETIQQHFGLDAVHVPYRGGSNALNDLAGGQIDVGIVAVAPAMPFISSGKIRPLAVTSEERAGSLPDVPSIAELGFEGFDSGSWAGIAVPKGTPPAVVDRLNAAIRHVMADPQVVQALESQSFKSIAGSPADMGKLIEQESARYGPLIQRLGLTAE
ncbi:Bug family tripartite tricarboxylate transporter substrate binding protein [Achromobacter mucicolens]|uniref:Bug family tripartite tricarboxylate transporter substrate binding protein n=1 Tax=Achromobacter mucicolens TaxID=1389922 RepID=UPI0022F3DBD5|nr:tripartite tricarboxylate transporter substrate binding protein [Achromobacter mucicolens]WBX88166.1 tripartite tricarboxylate transporter substrate binding protein [Achromobacter mucicolens]